MLWVEYYAWLVACGLLQSLFDAAISGEPSEPVNNDFGDMFDPLSAPAATEYIEDPIFVRFIFSLLVRDYHISTGL